MFTPNQPNENSSYERAEISIGYLSNTEQNNKSSQEVDLSLIQVLPNGRVDGENLHKFLQVRTKFADWIKRLITDYEFASQKDFLKFEKPHENNKTDYYLSIDMAKEICMVSKTKKGKEARKYFIACEEKSKQIIQPVVDQRQALLLKLFSNDSAEVATAYKTLVQLETKPLLEKIQVDAPKVEFADHLLQSKDAFDFSLAAQLMRLPFGRNTLFEKCRDLNILRMNNVPYQNYVDDKYFEVIPKPWRDKYGEKKVSYQTLITEKGQNWLLKKLGMLKCSILNGDPTTNQLTLN